MLRFSTILLLLTFGTLSSFSQIFEEVEGAVPVGSKTASRGVIFIDLNMDDYPDLYVVNGPKGGQNNELYLNDKNGDFVIAPAVIAKDGAATVGATFGDVNNDGHLDGYLANWYNESNVYYQGKEGGFDKEVVVGLGSRGHSESAAWGDFDGDGFLDLFIANSSFGSGEKNVLVAHQEDGSYKQLQVAATDVIANSRTVNWIDANGDGKLDLFVGNEQAGNELYLNVDNELVKDEANVFLTSRNDTFGSSWDDVDNDGDLDLLLVNFGSPNWISLNDGKAVFNSLRVGGGSANSIGSTFGDVDNDGDLDLFIANGFPTAGGTSSNELFLNDGNGSFSPVTNDPAVASSISSYGTALADYDNDGFLDLFVANTHGAPNSLFRNIGNDYNWIKIKCEGRLSNLSSIGAILKVKAKIDGKDVWQMRHISSQTGYTSQNDLKVHFGLKGATVIDSLVIVWPSGNAFIETDVAINQSLVVSEPIEQGQLRSNFSVSNLEFNEQFELTLENLSAFSELDEVDFSWDFDGDGEIDSEEFEPVATFASEGHYEIKLIATIGEITKEFSRTVLVNIGLTLGAADSVSVKVFPNPTNAFIKIKSPFKVQELRVLTHEGKEIKKVMAPGEEVTLAGFQPGNYMLIFQIGETTVTRKIIIE